jgi:hypothetical protein
MGNVIDGVEKSIVEQEPEPHYFNKAIRAELEAFDKVNVEEMSGTFLTSLNKWVENKNANCKYIIFTKNKRIKTFCKILKDEVMVDCFNHMINEQIKYMFHVTEDEERDDAFNEYVNAKNLISWIVYHHNCLTSLLYKPVNEDKTDEIETFDIRTYPIYDFINNANVDIYTSIETKIYKQCHKLPNLNIIKPEIRAEWLDNIYPFFGRPTITFDIDKKAEIIMANSFIIDMCYYTVQKNRNHDKPR